VAAAEFGLPADFAVVTTTYITVERLPIKQVSHGVDDEGTAVWQFHADNGDYDPSVLQLVSLAQILALDPELVALAGLSVGFQARRSAVGAPWIIEPDD